MSPTNVDYLKPRGNKTPLIKVGECGVLAGCEESSGKWFVHAGMMKEALGYSKKSNVGQLTRHAGSDQLRQRTTDAHPSSMWMSLETLQTMAAGDRILPERSRLIRELVDVLLFGDERGDVQPPDLTAGDDAVIEVAPPPVEQLHTLGFGGKPVRVFVDSDNDLMVVAQDVCRAIGLEHTGRAIQNVPERKRGVRKVHTPGGEQEMIVITEGAMYTLLSRSHRPEAEQFVEWVEQVLTSIRKHGFYVAPGAEKALPAAEPAQNDLFVQAVTTLANLDAAYKQTTEAITNRLGLAEARMQQLEQRPVTAPQMSEDQARRLVQEQLDIKTKTRDHTRGPYYGAPIPMEYRGWFLPTGIAEKIETPEELRNFLPVGEKYKTLGPRDVLRLMAWYGVLDYDALAPKGTLKWSPKGKLAARENVHYAIVNQCVGHHKSDNSPVYNELLLFSPTYAQQVIAFFTKKVKPRELIRRMICSWPSKYRRKDMDEFLSPEEADKYWAMKQSGVDPITVDPTADEENGSE